MPLPMVAELAIVDRFSDTGHHSTRERNQKKEEAIANSPKPKMKAGTAKQCNGVTSGGGGA